jgi:hypothetical protein
VASGKTAWGSVRKLPSGRYQARYRVDGKMATAPTTFRTKRDSEAYLSGVRADIERAQSVNPVAGRVTPRGYTTKCIEGMKPNDLRGRHPNPFASPTSPMTTLSRSAPAMARQHDWRFRPSVTSRSLP